MRTFTVILALMLSSLLMQAQNGEPCPGEPTVTYEGQTYNTILVGDRCWLKENLNVGTMILSEQNQANNGMIEKYCYGDLPANCETYGGFYQWKEAMQYDATPGALGICPPGWRIPTDDEWKMLEGAADSQYDYGDPEWDNFNYRGFDAGFNLKAMQGWAYNGNGTDTAGAAVLPGGHRDLCGAYYSESFSNYQWTATQQDYNTAWYRMISANSMQVSRRYAHKNMGASVRCIKEETLPQPFSCGDSFSDNRDGQSYTTIQIGDQCWMSENLAYLSEVSPSSQGSATDPYYYVYGYNGTDVNAAKATDNYNNYGALYNWQAALGACPDGWHLPSDNDWTVLADYIEAQGYPNVANDPNGAGNAMKSCRQINSPLGGGCNTTEHPRWISNPMHHGFDAFGWSGLPGGFRFSGFFFTMGNIGGWWTSTEDTSSKSWSRSLISSTSDVFRGNDNKDLGYSVRCLMD